MKRFWSIRALVTTLVMAAVAAPGCGGKPEGNLPPETPKQLGKADAEKFMKGMAGNYKGAPSGPPMKKR